MNDISLTNFSGEVIYAGTAPPFLFEIVSLIIASAIIAYICHRIGLVPIVGFLLAGILISPGVLGLVTNRELIDATAEIGVILLLFTIGLEFSLDKLVKIKKLIFLGGGLQVAITSLLVMALFIVFGAGWKVGLFTGFLIALSSTAIVLKLLSDRGETNSLTGRLGLSFLILQDLAIIPMVLLVPILGGMGGSVGEIVWVLVKAIAVVAIILILARKLMPVILELISRACSPELFLLSVIAICFGIAYLTSLAGISVSLGAFLAGLVVSESRFSQNALSEILPLQTLFSATFFVSVGMLLDLNFLYQNLPLVLAVIVVVLLIKVITTAAGVLVLGYKLPVAVALGLMLAQIGEFSFVLERTASEINLFPAGMAEVGSQTFIASTVILMILTPVLSQLGTRLSGRLEHMQSKSATDGLESDTSQFEESDLQNHVIVAGYGQASRKLVRILSESGIPYIITTLSPHGANDAERDGYPVLRGDASRFHILKTAGIDKAKMLIIADDEPGMAHRISSVAHNLNPTMQIIVRTRHTSDMELLTELGVDFVISEELESIVQLLLGVLDEYRIPKDEIDMHLQTMRGNNYAVLKAPPVVGSTGVVCASLDHSCLDSRTVTVHSGTVIIDKTISELGLSEKYNIKIEKINRNGKSIDNPEGGFTIKEGDKLHLSGTADAFADSAPLFRPATSADMGGTVVDDSPTTSPKYQIDTEQTIKISRKIEPGKCSHVNFINEVLPSDKGCEECLKLGDNWVHLRICMTCGHVGCCDDSKNKHSSKHYKQTEHPIIKSMEKGEDWLWCFEDEVML